MSVALVNDVRVSACKALGKGANLRRSSSLELMAYGGPAGDPQVAADLNTIRVWQRKLKKLRRLTKEEEEDPSDTSKRWLTVLDGYRICKDGRVVTKSSHGRMLIGKSSKTPRVRC
eukprot:1581489-Amphidinium_carterae.2